MPSAVLKKVILAAGLDGVEIAFCRAEKTDVTLEAIGMGDAMAQRDRGKVLIKARFLKRTADERQARMRCQCAAIRSHNLEAPHILITHQVNCPEPVQCLIRPYTSAAWGHLCENKVTMQVLKLKGLF